VRKARTLPAARPAALVSAALAVCAVPVAMIGPAATASSIRPTTVQPASTVCTALVSTPWQLPYSPYTKGDKYDVKVNKYSCGTADSYIKVLTADKVFKTPISLTPPSNVKGGPKGLICRSISDKSGQAYDGGCYSYTGGLANMNKPWFAWTVG
jgi:hypothetical protein